MRYAGIVDCASSGTLASGQTRKRASAVVETPARRLRARRLAAGAALEQLVRDTAGTPDTDDLAALIASRDAQVQLVVDTMHGQHVAVIDRGSHFTLTLLGRVAGSCVSAEAAILNWAIATRREWRARRDGLVATPPPERTAR